MRRLFAVGSLLVGVCAAFPDVAGASGAMRRDDGQYTPGILPMALLASGLTALSLVSLLRRRRP